MKFILILFLTLLLSDAYSQAIPECSVTERIQSNISIGVNGLLMKKSISRSQMIKHGFILIIHDTTFKVRSFAVTIPCLSGWLLDLGVRRFIGNSAPPNNKVLMLLEAGEILNITEIILEKQGRCYKTNGVQLNITD